MGVTRARFCFLPVVKRDGVNDEDVDALVVYIVVCADVSDAVVVTVGAVVVVTGLMDAVVEYAGDDEEPADELSSAFPGEAARVVSVRLVSQLVCAKRLKQNDALPPAE